MQITLSPTNEMRISEGAGVNLAPVREDVPLLRRRERPDMRLDKVEKDPVRVPVHVEAVGDEGLERPSLAFGVPQRGAARIEVGRQRDGFLHDAFMQVDQDDARHRSCDLSSRLGVGGTDGGPTGAFLVPVGQIKRGQADLVQRRRGDQQNLGAVRPDPLMGEDLGQVLLVLFEWDALRVRRDGESSVVRP